MMHCRRPMALAATLAVATIAATGCDEVAKFLPFLQPSPPGQAATAEVDPLTQEVLAASAYLSHVESALAAREDIDLLDAAAGAAAPLRIQSLDGHPALPCEAGEVAIEDGRGRKLAVRTACAGDALVRTLVSFTASGSAIVQATQSVTVSLAPEPSPGVAGSGEVVLRETIMRGRGGGGFGGAEAMPNKIERLRSGTYSYDPAADPPFQMAVVTEAATRSETVLGGGGGLGGAGNLFGGARPNAPGGTLGPPGQGGPGGLPGGRTGTPRVRPSGAGLGNRPGVDGGTGSQAPTPGTLVETFTALDFAAPRAASPPSWLPRRLPGHVVGDAMTTTGDQQTRFHWEGSGNRWDGVEIVGSFTDAGGAAATFSATRAADGSAREVWSLPGGKVLEATTPAGGTQMLVLKSAAGAVIATITTENGQILINGKPLTRQGGGASREGGNQAGGPGSGVLED